MGAFDGILKTLGLKKGNNKPKDPLTVPKTVQQSIPYKGAYENGIIQVDNDTFSKMYRLSDLNFAIESNDEQKKILGRFMEFISSFGPEVHIQTCHDDADTSVGQLVAYVDDAHVEELSLVDANYVDVARQ